MNVFELDTCQNIITRPQPSRKLVFQLTELDEQDQIIQSNLTLKKKKKTATTDDSSRKYG